MAAEFPLPHRWKRREKHLRERMHIKVPPFAGTQPPVLKFSCQLLTPFYFPVASC